MYKQISDYGLIGDMHSAALVSNEGSIDYCAMPHIDSPAVFAALLDDEKGGFFRIQPRGEFESEQGYIKDTNILSCIFKTGTGEARLIDFMPVRSGELFEKKEHIIHRCLEIVSGSMDFRLEFFPKPRYAAGVPGIEQNKNFFKVKFKGDIFALKIKLDEYEIKENNSGGLIIHFSLQESQEAHFDFVCGEEIAAEEDGCGFQEAQRFWLEWLYNCEGERCGYWGEFTPMLNRSLLVLKLLTFQPTGAIAAAATTSLPESIGGERNWDYRFTWIRDASWTLKAMFALGHIAEADSFVRWLHTTYQRYGSRNLQIMYSLTGEKELKEQLLGHLKGYKNSRPVRVGNSAFKQPQWDIYGEVMDTALRLSDYAGKIDESLWPFFRDVCNLAIQNWRKPDYGIWEVRNGPFHFVYSKVMCWVALDRGIKIAKRYGFEAPLDDWEKERDEIKEEVLEKGYDSELKSFVQRYGSKNLDASLLLLGLMDFLPLDDSRIQGTIDACKTQLMNGDFLLRYKTDDGIEGEEGAFLLCNFWLIETLALSGKVREARELLVKTSKAANPLGLFSEEFDPKTNQLLGNFPQAFSHIGCINAVSAILNIEGKLNREKADLSLIERMRKLMPLRVELNKSSDRRQSLGMQKSPGEGFLLGSDFFSPPMAEPCPKKSLNAPETAAGRCSYSNKEIAAELKISLNNLQGGFFDILEGRVNYEALKRSEGFRNYSALAERLGDFDPFTIKSDAEKKAFWINIYNILIIHGVIHFDIQKSVKEVFNFFARIGYTVNGFFLTPDSIEHGILRGNRLHPVSRLRQFSLLDKRKVLCVEKFDPRIHFALVCASGSCPPIEFYSADSIDEQLDTAGESFINRKGLILKQEENTVYLSQIFKWYAPDFGKDERGVLEFAAAFADEKNKEYLLEKRGRMKIKYLPYDWDLNRALE